MTTAATDIGTLIYYKKTIGGRRACVKSGVSVKLIVIRHLHWGETVGELVEDHELLTPELVHAGLAYYYANKDEIDFEIAEDSRINDEEAAKARRRK